MGKEKHKDPSPFPPVTQQQVNESLKPHGDLPPQSDELKARQAILGTRVRAFDGAHMVTTEITDYQNGHYHGVGRRCFGEPGEKLPVESIFHNLTRFPNAANPTAPEQFVLPGEDEAPLLNVYNVHREAGVPEVGDQDSGTVTNNSGNN